MKLRILELGSNSFQLHGFEVTAGGSVRHAWGQKRSVRLADGLAEDGTLDARYAALGVNAVGALLAESRDQTPLVCFATAAVREAGNRDILLDPIARRHGLAPRILSGAEEAKLAYAGALSSLDGPIPRVCVVDIGGGSTEVAVGDHLGVGFTHSARVGTLLGDRALPALETLLLPVLDRVRLYEPERLVFASGTARALKKLFVAQGLIEPHCPIPTDVLARLMPNLALLNADDLAAFGIGKDRHPTLAPGAGLVLAVARALGVSYLDVSVGGVREGAALREWNRRRLRPGAPCDPISDRLSPVPYAAAGGWLPMLGA